MNENEKPMQEAMTPPPFRPDGPIEPAQQEPSTSPTPAQKIQTLGLDQENADRLSRLTEGLDAESTSDELLNTLARGITHDSDVQNADAAGYLRGRNEKIEAVLHPQADDGDEMQSTPVFPQYRRRSIWD